MWHNTAADKLRTQVLQLEGEVKKAKKAAAEADKIAKAEAERLSKVHAERTERIAEANAKLAEANAEIDRLRAECARLSAPVPAVPPAADEAKAAAPEEPKAEAPEETPDEAEQRKSAVADRVLAVIRAQPGIRAPEIAVAAEIGRAVTGGMLTRLRTRGLIEADGAGGWRAVMSAG